MPFIENQRIGSRWLTVSSAVLHDSLPDSETGTAEDSFNEFKHSIPGKSFDNSF